MAYDLMKQLIRIHKKSKKDLIKKANMYYAADQLTDEQYAEIMQMIEEAYPDMA